MESKAGVVIAGLSPHPPIVVPEVGGTESSQTAATYKALTLLGSEFVAARPDLVVVIGPHGPVFRDAVSCSSDPTIKGDLGDFGAPMVKVSFRNDIEFAKRVREMALATGACTRVMMVSSDQQHRRQFGEGCDHGALIPLYFLSKAGLEAPVVLFTMGFLPYIDLYEFGMTIAAAARDMKKRIAVLASGDLSHRLLPDSPNGYSPRGAEFDRVVMDSIGKANPRQLMRLDESLIEDAGECGLRPIFMMLGALDGLKVSARVLSYEGPFGVGYGVALLKPTGASKTRKFRDKWRGESEAAMKMLRDKESPHVALARKTLETYVREGKRVPVGDAGETLLRSRAGVFVSLKKHGQLRGCIGTTEPTTRSLAEEIVQNAIAAGLEDPRFGPVQPEELPDIVYSVDVLSPAEMVAGPRDLDPKVYGVIVEKGSKRGLLLPDLEGIDTVEKQVSIAKQKAGIRPAEDVRLYRFTVTRYH